jgi:Mlc titration factor MtfA (ptsG expression regulator)
MVFRWLRRRRALRAPFPAAWEPFLEGLRFFSALTEAERARLRKIVQVLVAEKHWEGCGGLVLTEEKQVVIAAQAARLILHVEHRWFHNVMSILVYPTTYASPLERRGADGIVTQGKPLLGEAWHQGPVVIAWDAVEEARLAPQPGQNVVLHEFAHKLDMLDGYVDGTPPLSGGGSYRIWARVMGEEYERLVEEARRGRRTVLDAYGATDHGEFFAVATECFFERPLPLRADCPTLYDLLCRYFGQDPASRLAPATVAP